MQAKVSFSLHTISVAVGPGPLTAALINSAYYRFSERRLTMEVVAHRVIDPGEEVFISCKCLAARPQLRVQS